MLDVVAIFLVVTALLAYLNQRLVRLPITIGVMAGALLLSLVLIVLGQFGPLRGLRDLEKSLLQSVDFSEVLLQGMLSVLLFASALHVDLSALREYRWQVGLLAIGATVASTALVGVAMWLLLPLLGLPLTLIHCLLFGALISPTDPIAVAGILKSAGAPRNLELVISGESLFNDGVGVVIFSLLFTVLLTGESPSWGDGLVLLAREAGGGLLFGLGLGLATFQLLRSIDQYQVEVLITLAAVLGGYALASHLHVSGPLAMVVAGLVIGNDGRALAMSDTTRHHVDLFWELLDEMLNAVLFVLIGLEIVLIQFSPASLLAGAAAIAATLLARLLTVGLPVHWLGERFRLPPGAWSVLTWGGLRGGISVALVLALPPGPARELLLTLTYCVVLFSILVQGLTIGRVVRRCVRDA